MTVSQLITELKKLPGDLEIWYSTAYDSDKVESVSKLRGGDIFGANPKKEIVHLTYW